jgi:uncharacterized membrane protein YphA (DoxX/SURF4 family)
MLSVFPAFLDYGFYAVSLLRITTGFFFLLFGMRLLQATKSLHNKNIVIVTIGFIYGVLQVFVGVSLTLGVYTQLGALFGAVLTFITFIQGVTTKIFASNQQVQILLFILCFSLLFLGPGSYAIDFPL